MEVRVGRYISFTVVILVFADSHVIFLLFGRTVVNYALAYGIVVLFIDCVMRDIMLGHITYM